MQVDDLCQDSNNSNRWILKESKVYVPTDY